MALTREGLLGRKPTRVAKRVESMDEDVVLRVFSPAERLEISGQLAQMDESSGAESYIKAMMLIVAQSLCDPESGEPMWANGDAEAEGVPALMTKLTNVQTDELTAICLDVNSMGQNAKAVRKQIVGNSDEIPSSSSSSSSLGISDTAASSASPAK